jgi:predicted metal-dependent HD superfamily phosphohydrolase
VVHAPPPGILTLAGRFELLVSRLGATADPTPLFGRLAAAWQEPHRHYHNTEHLVDCLGQVDLLPAGEERDRAEVALWFHDAVYDPHAGDNEARSAAWAREGLASLGVSATIVEEVARLVLATRHVGPPADAVATIVTDIDLSILGRDPETYEQYERRVRREYAWVPEPRFRRERARILSGLLERRPLYSTTLFRDRYERAARENLARAVARLTRG